MTEQRIPFSVREEARLGLQDWWADRIDSWFFNQLAGYAIQNDINFTGLQAATEPAGTNSLNIGPLANAYTTESSLNSASAATANPMTLALIDRLVMVAKTKSPQIRPIRIGANDHYVMFLHPEQVNDLRSDIRSAGATTVSWAEIQMAAMKGGDVTENPIFTGALGMYNNVILHESTRVPHGGSTAATGTLTNVRRAIFCGAQACGIAFGRGFGQNRMSWTEELFDYRNQLGVSAGLIGGLKKFVYNSNDFATLVQVTGVTENS